MAKKKSKQSKANKAELEVQAPSSPPAEVVSISSRRTSQEKPIASDNETVTPEDKTIASEDETITPEDKTIASEDETITPEDKTVASEDETITPEENTPEDNTPEDNTEEKPEAASEAEPPIRTAASPKPTRPSLPSPPSPSISDTPQHPKNLPSIGSGPKKIGLSRGSRGAGLPRPKKVVPITQCGEFNAGDTVTLPYSGKTVTLTNFYQGSTSGDWWAAFDGGCVQVKALKSSSV